MVTIQFNHEANARPAAERNWQRFREWSIAALLFSLSRMTLSFVSSIEHP
jgi:hypothetical protein